MKLKTEQFLMPDWEDSGFRTKPTCCCKGQGLKVFFYCSPTWALIKVYIVISSLQTFKHRTNNYTSDMPHPVCAFLAPFALLLSFAVQMLRGTMRTINEKIYILDKKL